MSLARFHLSLLALIFASCFDIQAQKIKSIGLPMMTTYSQVDYDFSSHNFDVLIGDDQKIYFANNSGILVFDGVNWTQLKLPKETPVYTLAKSGDGTIYVGATNEIGYLEFDKSGALIYVSLLSTDHQELGTFTARVYALEDKIVASIEGKFILIDPRTKSTTILDHPEEGCSLQSVNGKLYAFCGDQLYQYKKGEWQFIRESHLLEDMQIGRGHLIDISASQTFAITQNGFFDFETEEELDVKNEVKNFLSKSMIYRVSKISDKYIAICSWSGLLITDFKGNPILLLNKEKGLPDDHLFRAELDKHGMLWIATYNGIAKIDLFSAYTVLDKRVGVEGVIKDVQLHKGDLYFSAIEGVFREDWNSLKDPFFTPAFEKVNASVCHQMINTGKDLFVYTERQNNLVLENDRFQEIEGTQEKIYWAGFKYKNSEDLLLASHDGFLTHVVKENSKWIVRKRLDPQFLGVYFLIEGEDNEIWLSNIGEGIYRMKYDIQSAELLEDKKYGIADGLPDLNNHVYEIDSKPCFTTSKGIYRFDTSTDSFVADERFIDVIGQVPVSMISEDEKGNLYYFSDEFVMLKKTSDGFKKTVFSNMDFKKYPPSDITVIDHENVIISTLNAFIHVNPNQESLKNEYDVAIIGLFSLNSDSMIYNGFGEVPDNLLFQTNDNALRLTFSAVFYQNPERTLYKWRLLGFDEKWSDWSSETQKDYTNLSHGMYTFEVMAKNIYGLESEPARMNFSIETPWYFTVWAYILYFIGLTLFIWMLIRFNTGRIKLEKEKLEHIVEDRTKQLIAQREQALKDADTISKQNDELVKMDELKRRFFVNISHELRTPLTLTMGTVDQAINGKYGEINEVLKNNLEVSFRNSERLLKMVNNILDISKLEGGQIQVYASLVKPGAILSKVLAFFDSRFSERKIELIQDIDADIQIYLDQDKFETIFINLLSNAFKFTAEGGQISVALIEYEEHVSIIVKDNGEGIPEKDLPYVFDRFYQSPHIKSGEGLGVGLALVKELVGLHKGEISVSNSDGAVFIVTLKKGKDHFSANQILVEIDHRPLKSLSDKYLLRDDSQVKVNEESLDNESLPHILLVEDNLEMINFVSDLLVADYRISIAKNGREGLQFLEKNNPDLIVTDYLMPEMDGYEMALEIKKSSRLALIPMIFLTARAREQDKIRVLNLGVDDYLFKPFNTEELLVRVKNLLHYKRQRLEYVEENEVDDEEISWLQVNSKLKASLDQYIDEHIKEEITGEQLAECSLQSERSLYRKVKANTGLSLMQYVKEYRLRKARTLLENNEFLNVSEVSYAVGFNYLSHFTKSYKERFGKQPSEYLD